MEKLTEKIGLKVSRSMRRDVEELSKRERRSMNQLFIMGMEMLLEKHKKTAKEEKTTR